MISGFKTSWQLSFWLAGSRCWPSSNLSMSGVHGSNVAVLQSPEHHPHIDCNTNLIKRAATLLLGCLLMPSVDSRSRTWKRQDECFEMKILGRLQWKDSHCGMLPSPTYLLCAFSPCYCKRPFAWNSPFPDFVIFIAKFSMKLKFFCSSSFKYHALET